MSMDKTSIRKILTSLAVGGLLVAGLGACQDQRTSPNDPAKNPPPPGQSQAPSDQKMSGEPGQRGSM